MKHSTMVKATISLLLVCSSILMIRVFELQQFYVVAPYPPKPKASNISPGFGGYSKRNQADSAIVVSFC